MQTQEQLPWQERPAPPEGGYFVGRRPHEAAEVYLVKPDDVERLRAERLGDMVALDWRLGPDELLELSRTLLSRAGDRELSPELELRFASVIRLFPESGFVLSTDAVAAWLNDAGAALADSPAPPPSTRRQRLRSTVRQWWRR
jgi:hypothetical protein